MYGWVTGETMEKVLDLPSMPRRPDSSSKDIMCEKIGYRELEQLTMIGVRRRCSLRSRKQEGPRKVSMDFPRLRAIMQNLQEHC